MDRVYSPTLYRDRPEWADIKPIYNSEREEGAVKIAATEECKVLLFDPTRVWTRLKLLLNLVSGAYAYLRAIYTAGEMSERAFELTGTCLQLNPANYSVWQYRRKLIKALDKSVEEELRFSESVAAENPKNYQVWHHRKALVTLSRDPSTELEFTASFLQDDSKNYHAWQYRQWVVGEFNLYSDEELIYSMEHLLSDLRNNSAWNYRYFILSRLSDGFKDAAAVEKEIAFTLQCIKRVPSNESSWSYLSGILTMREGLSSNTQTNSFCNDLLAQREPICKSPHLRSFLVDCLVEKIERGGDDVAAHVKEAQQLLNELEALDPIRQKYWKYRWLYIQNLVARS